MFNSPLKITGGDAHMRRVLALALLLAPACSDSPQTPALDPALIAAGPRTTRSSSIALTANGQFVVVANRDANTISMVRVRNSAGQDAFETVAEIGVGFEPRYVALSPDDKRAYVSNAQSGTVSVVSLTSKSIIKTIFVGAEPRGLALGPNGKRLFVANHTAGTLSIIDTAALVVVDEVAVGKNPTALAVTNDGDSSDLDETVFVSEFFAEPIPGGPGEGFDDGRQGVIWALPSAGGVAAKITLAPLAPSAVGFGADRKPYCADFNANVHSEIFCPDTSISDPTSPVVSADPQGAFPNQLQALVLRRGLLFAPNIGAAPEPPVRFNVNVQALVNVVDATARVERPELAVNLNAQIKLETQPVPAEGRLERLFGNDLVAIDADQLGSSFLIVSRGGNHVLRAFVDAAGNLSIGAPNNVVRFQTGHLPNGVVMRPDGKRAYVYNEVGLSVTAIDLVNNVVLQRDIPSATPPAPGSFQHAVAVGKLAFSTALGLPDFGALGTPLRAIDPLQHRNKASDNGWSSCASCHPDGLSDNVTWMFATGPRSTVPLDAFFSKFSPLDQRISNWSGVMGSVTDFNNNARGVQGGTGFAGNPPPTQIFQHGITQGASDSLDAMTLWVQTVRALNQPEPTDLAAFAGGAAVFADNCASCHGGPKWSKSQVVYDNNPTFNKDAAQGGVAFDPGLTTAGPQIVQLTETNPQTAVTLTLRFLDPVGTFSAANPLELRGAGGAQGTTALGGLGFNAPSLLGANYHGPYLHDGSAQTFADVFARHGFGAGTIESSFNAQELLDLEVFIKSIDGATPTIDSDTDAFLRAIRG
jgi:YVTN family beta-propeller protein